MEKTKKNDDQIIKCLDVKVIRRLICITDKGNLDLVIRKGESNYFLSLDATPLDKEVNDKLMGILFKPEVPTVKFNQLEPLPINPSIPFEPKGIEGKVINKKGRPAKVK
jgi:hypothetical protein